MSTRNIGTLWIFVSFSDRLSRLCHTGFCEGFCDSATRLLDLTRDGAPASSGRLRRRSWSVPAMSHKGIAADQVKDIERPQWKHGGTMRKPGTHLRIRQMRKPKETPRTSAVLCDPNTLAKAQAKRGRRHSRITNMLTSHVGAVAVPRQRGSWKPTPNMSDLRILVTAQVILLSLYHETFIGFMMIHGSLWIIFFFW